MRHASRAGLGLTCGTGQVFEACRDNSMISCKMWIGMPRPHGTYLLLGDHNRFLTSWGPHWATATFYVRVCMCVCVCVCVCVRGAGVQSVRVALTGCIQDHEKKLMMGFDLSRLDIGTVSPRVTRPKWHADNSHASSQQRPHKQTITAPRSLAVSPAMPCMFARLPEPGFTR